MPNRKSKKILSLRDFPAVEILAGRPEFKPFAEVLPRPMIIKTAKEVTSRLKKIYRSGKKELTESDLINALKKELNRLAHLDLKPVINGAGIIIHTNLGRSPISADMIRDAVTSLSGYSNLEYSLDTGRRGKRGVLIEQLLALFCGTESGTIVNNNAAALFIILNSLSNRREVIISRGELVQIGGGFKIPEIMTKSGVKLVEVGTTNRTSIDDYRSAITKRTRMILKVHRSNFEQTGFVEETEIKELAILCQEENLIFVNDLGSGLVTFPAGIKIPNEPSISASVRAGADLTCFSGDKLLGGVQSGLIAGRLDLITRIKRNPLFRAVRCDKITFALTTRVLGCYLNGTQFEDIPIWQMIGASLDSLKKRAKKIAAACKKHNLEIIKTEAYFGGGSTPQQAIPSIAVSIRTEMNANRVAATFRDFSPPIIGRVEEDRFIIDLRAVPSDSDKIIINAINQLLG